MVDTPTGEHLRKLVFDNLDAAIEENNYGPELLLLSPLQIGYDMIAYAADVEDQTAEVLAPHIEAWLREKGHKIYG